jgi:hypothetical protein
LFSGAGPKKKGKELKEKRGYLARRGEAAVAGELRNNIKIQHRA